MDEQIEKHLICKAQNGDIAAFEALIIDYEKRIYNICLRMLGDEQEAYDGAQEICVKLWKQLHTFEGNSKFSTWVYRISTNQCLDLIRKRKHRLEEEVSLYQTSKDSETEWVLEVGSKRDEMGEHVEQMVLQDIMKQALTEVKEEYKQILLLRDIEGLSYDEIAEALEMNKGTVKSRLSRARLAMKQILTQNKEPYKSFFRQTIKKEGNI
ncbi:MAG: RNA polymerase sigma factor [Niameybacter sp.]|uniref:RNA polymerase sigma factor n=1 Tax=Niameybacter sp. TaxID=2033640 RepID=UPI002FC8D46F